VSFLEDDAEIAAMWFYDLRAKAADDTADNRGEQAASNLLGHENITTTKRHYLRRGKTALFSELLEWWISSLTL
jgi:integrase